MRFFFFAQIYRLFCKEWFVSQFLPLSVSFFCPTAFFPTESISAKGWGKVPHIIGAFEPGCSINVHITEMPTKFIKRWSLEAVELRVFCCIILGNAAVWDSRGKCPEFFLPIQKQPTPQCQRYHLRPDGK